MTQPQSTVRKQHLAADELERAIINALARHPRGMIAPQVAREIGAPVQTVRYRLSQLSSARVASCEWHRRFLFFYLGESRNSPHEQNDGGA
jgi:predicted transcriptional regulator